MNIGIDVRGTYKKKTGIGIYIAEIIRQLNEFDKENNYFLYSTKEIALDFKLNNNFKTRENINGKLKFYLLMPKLLKEDNIDVYWGANYILPKKNKNMKYVVTIHDLAIKKLKTVGAINTTIVQNLLLEKSIKRADKIITISNATKSDIMECYNVKEEKINVIYPGTNKTLEEIILTEEKKEEIQEKLKIKNTPYLFFLSTIEPRKNIETLIKAFDYIKSNNDTNLKLVIAGGLGWKYGEVLRLFEESKYKEDIIMPGYISKEEKEYLYKNAECFVYPSLYEGFGLPVLEAMLNKVLVITANNSSLPEAGGDVAFYYNNVLDYKELAEEILKVRNLSDKEKQEKIDEGLKHIEKFTWEECTKKVLDVLK